MQHSHDHMAGRPAAASVGPIADRLETGREADRELDVALALGIAMLEVLEPRQAALATFSLTTGMNIATAATLEWSNLAEGLEQVVLHDAGLATARTVPVPGIAAAAILRLGDDGRSRVFADDQDSAWPLRLLLDTGDGERELTGRIYRNAFLSTAGRHRMLQAVVDGIAPPRSASASEQLVRYREVVDAVADHYAPLIATGRRLVAEQNVKGGPLPTWLS